MVYSRDTEVSFLMSCSLKVTQYMHQPTRQLYNIWMSVPKVKEKLNDLRGLTLRSVFYTALVHSHKKRKDSLETRAVFGLILILT